MAKWSYATSKFSKIDIWFVLKTLPYALYSSVSSWNRSHNLLSSNLVDENLKGHSFVLVMKTDMMWDILWTWQRYAKNFSWNIFPEGYSESFLSPHKTKVVKLFTKPCTPPWRSVIFFLMILAENYWKTCFIQKFKNVYIFCLVL